MEHLCALQRQDGQQHLGLRVLLRSGRVGANAAQPCVHKGATGRGALAFIRWWRPPVAPHTGTYLDPDWCACRALLAWRLLLPKTSFEGLAANLLRPFSFMCWALCRSAVCPSAPENRAVGSNLGYVSHGAWVHAIMSNP
jgi:hypothetical protein